jgi:WD40 repeat protein
MSVGLSRSWQCVEDPARASYRKGIVFRARWVIEVVSVPDGNPQGGLGGWYSTLRVWDVDSGASRALEGHTGPVSSIVVLLDGRVVSSSFWDNTLRVWDVERGTQIAVFVGDAEMTVCAAAGPALIAVGSANGAVHILELHEE